MGTYSRLAGPSRPSAVRRIGTNIVPIGCGEKGGFLLEISGLDPGALQLAVLLVGELDLSPHHDGIMRQGIGSASHPVSAAFACYS